MSEHDCAAAVRGFEARTIRLKLEHVVQNLWRGMQVVKCFKERNDIERWNIFGRTESSFCQAVNIGYVLRAGGKRDDVAPQGLLAVPALNSRYRPEGVEHLDRHWGDFFQLASGLRVQFSQGAPVNLGVLAYLEFGEVEPKCFHLPDQVLDLRVGAPLISSSYE